MHAHCPALLIAAPASGQGKTTVTAALARLLARQGKRVQVFKCGPDFIDPMWHELASGQPVYSIDLWINGEADIRARLYHAALHNDILLIEGVMGLYDGQPSAADIARCFGLPVLAVISARAMAGTFGAIAYGLQHYQTQSHGALPWAGVLANQVGSSRHAQMLEVSLEQPATFWGAVLQQASFALPERHLGLHLAHELPDALPRLDALADALESTRLGQLCQDPSLLPATRFEAPEAQALPPLLQGRTIAIARDAAFCFIYPANLDCLRALGAQLVFFSPLADEALPPCDALWLPGGYPELHAERLGQATQARASVAAHVQAEKPVWAECGGMMLLFDSITQKDASRQVLWGLLPGAVTMQARFAGLGSQQCASPYGALRGHTFHHSTVQTPLAAVAHSQHANSGEQGEAIYRHGSITASYLHLYFAANPQACAALLGAGHSPF